MNPRPSVVRARIRFFRPYVLAAAAVTAGIALAAGSLTVSPARAAAAESVTVERVID